MTTFAADATGIIITPIAQSVKPENSGKPDSLRDYREQCDRFSKGQPMCWDDDAQNKTKIGDIFGFCKNKMLIRIEYDVNIIATSLYNDFIAICYGLNVILI